MEMKNMMYVYLKNGKKGHKVTDTIRSKKHAIDYDKNLDEIGIEIFDPKEVYVNGCKVWGSHE